MCRSRMNFGDFEAHVRSGMDDSITDYDDTNATWSTLEIAEYFNDAVADYSFYFPRNGIDTIEVTAGTASYSLPDDIINPPDSAIELLRWRRPGYQYDHMERLSWPPGSTESISTSGTGMGYYIWNMKLVLADSPSAQDAAYDIDIWYRRLHTVVDATMSGEVLRSTELSVPVSDRSLLFWYVTGCMMGKLEAGDAFLRQYADRGDLGIYRDDSPPRRSANWRMQRYDEGIALRLAKARSPKLRR